MRKVSMVEEGQSFPLALMALKTGRTISRAGWNGKSMYLYLNKGSYPTSVTIYGDFPPKEEVYPFKGTAPIYGVNKSFFEEGAANTVVRMPCIVMVAANGEHVHGWLASQTDMLADDWCIFETR